jgi:hypothetical protein
MGDTDIIHWKIKKTLKKTLKNPLRKEPAEGQAKVSEPKAPIIQVTVSPGKPKAPKPMKGKFVQDNDTKRLLAQIPKSKVPGAKKGEFKVLKARAALPRAMLASDYGREKPHVIRSPVANEPESEMIITNNYAKYMKCISSGIKYVVKVKVNDLGYVEVYIYNNPKGLRVFETYVTSNGQIRTWVDVYQPNDVEIAKGITYESKISSVFEEMSKIANGLNNYNPTYVVDNDKLERVTEEARKKANDAYSNFMNEVT